MAEIFVVESNGLIFRLSNTLFVKTLPRNFNKGKTGLSAKKLFLVQGSHWRKHI